MDRTRTKKKLEESWKNEISTISEKKILVPKTRVKTRLPTLKNQSKGRRQKKTKGNFQKKEISQRKTNQLEMKRLMDPKPHSS